MWLIRKRATIGVGLIFLLMLGVFGRLIQLQVVEHERWLAQAAGAQERILVQQHPRGRIYDRNGVLLAADVLTRSIALDTYHLEEPEALLSILSRHLGLSRESLREKFQRKTYFTWIKRKVDLATAEKIRQEMEEAGARGLIFIEEWQRVYPQGELASNVLGFAGIDGQGLEGVELACDPLLRGEPTELKLVRAGDGTVIARRVLRPGRPGYDLVLTLDARIQHLAEEKITWGVERFRAKDGFIIVMDPYTGELLALAQAKRYDLNRFDRSSPEERLNLAVSWPFEPGSVLKVFVALAALEAGVVAPGERFSGNEPLRLAGHLFHNAQNRSYGWVTLRDIIRLSINTGMIRVALRLGEARLRDYLARLGFGRLTGVGLPGEVPGTLRPVEEWSGIDIGAVAIGQSLAVTGIQLARAGAALANGGWLVQPRLIKEIRGEAQARVRARGSCSAQRPHQARRIASPENIDLLREMMRAVVESGTGTKAKLEGFDVAAKSGTAQKALPGLGYVPGRYVSSFLGFFPADRPRFLILVVLDEVGVEPFWGGHTAGVVFRELAERLIDLENLSPKE